MVMVRVRVWAREMARLGKERDKWQGLGREMARARERKRLRGLGRNGEGLGERDDEGDGERQGQR